MRVEVDSVTSGLDYATDYVFGPGSAAYSDRAYTLDDLGHFLPADGFVYVRQAADDMSADATTVQFTLTCDVACSVFLVFRDPETPET
jgi:hypothetical protein